MSESGRHPDASLGERIAQHRTRRGWSQEELAHRAGVSRASIQNAEVRGGAGRSVITRIAAALGMTYDQLTTDGPVDPPALADIPTDVLAAELHRRLAAPATSQTHRYEVPGVDGSTVTVLSDRPLDPAERDKHARTSRTRRADAASRRK
jgi:transcriptional regulator with XRE-family HTH domain